MTLFYHRLTLFLGFVFMMMAYWPPLSAQESDIIPGVINVKFSVEAAPLLAQMKSGEAGILESRLFMDTGIETSEMRAVFGESQRFAERHQRAGLDRWYQVRVHANGNEPELARALMASGLVEHAEPDYRIVLFDDFPAIPADHSLSDADLPFDDPRLNEQWGYNNTGANNGLPGADIKAYPSWEISTGIPEVVVQVVDSGIIVEHPDLENMLWVNPYLSESPRQTDVHGWNFRSNNDHIRDDNGHGTHVAGVVAAQANNNVGIAGIAGGDGSGDGVRLMISRLFENGFGSGSLETAESFRYGADYGAVISTNSWGYQNPDLFPTLVREGIDYFIANAGYDEHGNVTGPIAGGVVIFASGNSNRDDRIFPAAYSEVIAVAATNNQDKKAAYSNYGTHIDISAPGGETPGNPLRGILSTDLESRSFFAYRQGTSMAAPHVAGAAALMASHFPGITNEELVERLLNSTDSILALNPEYIGQLGTGRLNLFRALSTDSPPAMPKPIQPARNEVDVQIVSTFIWTDAPFSDLFHFQLSTDSTFSPGTLVYDVDGINDDRINISGLSLARTYYWRVRGFNQKGYGRWSIPALFTTALKPPPSSPQLLQNYPNPFNPTTIIEFGLEEDSDVLLEVYTVTGQRVATLISGPKTIGWHTVPFDATALASGVYIYRLRAGNQLLDRKMLFVK